MLIQLSLERLQLFLSVLERLLCAFSLLAEVGSASALSVDVLLDLFKFCRDLLELSTRIGVGILVLLALLLCL